MDGDSEPDSQPERAAIGTRMTFVTFGPCLQMLRTRCVRGLAIKWHDHPGASVAKPAGCGLHLAMLGFVMVET